MINILSQVLEIRRQLYMKLSTDLLLDYATCPKKRKVIYNLQEDKEYFYHRCERYKLLFSFKTEVGS
jgi:hypothetical protein